MPKIIVDAGHGGYDNGAVYNGRREKDDFSRTEIAEIFGSEVALLVDGVTKLGQLSYSADKLEVQAENLRKMFLAMAQSHV